MPLLNELPVGAVARVTCYSDRNAPCRRRLLSMGLTPGLLAVAGLLRMGRGLICRRLWATRSA